MKALQLEAHKGSGSRREQQDEQHCPSSNLRRDKRNGRGKAHIEQREKNEEEEEDDEGEREPRHRSDIFNHNIRAFKKSDAASAGLPIARWSIVMFLDCGTGKGLSDPHEGKPASIAMMQGIA